MRKFGEHTIIEDGQEIYVKGVDQLVGVINSIKYNPGSRRIIMTLWDPRVNPHTLLPPCPCFYHFNVLNGKLHLLLYQRSCDYFLGVPFNTAQDSLLLLIVAQVCGIPAGDFIHTFGDVHLYSNHIEQAKKQLQREPRPLPKLELDASITSIEEFSYPDSFTLTGYEPHPPIKASVAV